jgi:hypothetical protein
MLGNTSAPEWSGMFAGRVSDRAKELVHGAR